MSEKVIMLNELAAEIHVISQMKGFWPDGDRERNPGEVLMLIVTEVAEAMEEIRDGYPVDLMRYTVDFKGIQKPIGVPSELADIIIRVLDASAAWGIDIDAAVREKTAYNAQRERLHGRAR